MRIGTVRQFDCPEGTQGGVDSQQAFVPLDSDYFVLTNSDILYLVLPDCEAV